MLATSSSTSSSACCHAEVYSERNEYILQAPFQIEPAVSLKAALDCRVQASLNNPESENLTFGQDQMLDKKREKRRAYKKRKKQKIRIMQNQNKDEFKRIIDNFYEKNAKFKNYEDRLEELVCSFNQNEFKNIFDSILKQRVLIIQNSIWNYTQSILQQNPLQMRHDHPFYLDMIDQLYRHYRVIENSSKEAEQVIYIYLTLNSKQDDEPITPQQLGIRTFRYMIETDETLRKLIHMCDRKTSLVRLNERRKLQIMISKLKCFRERFHSNFANDDNEDDQDDDYIEEEEQTDDEDSEGGYCGQENCIECMSRRREAQENYQVDHSPNSNDNVRLPHETAEDQKSTAFSDNENVEEFDQHVPLKKKKLKKSSNFVGNAESLTVEDSLMRRLENLTIKENSRKSCVFEAQCIEKLHERLYQLKKQKIEPEIYELNELHRQLEKEKTYEPLSKEKIRLLMII